MWSEDQIKNYQRMKDEEDIELLSSINESIKEAMESLGDELKAYLEEGGEIIEKQTKPENPQENTISQTVKGLAEPFVSVIEGIKEVASPLKAIVPKRKGSEAKKGDDVKDSLEINELKKRLKTELYQTYKNYKKMHNMMTW